MKSRNRHSRHSRHSRHLGKGWTPFIELSKSKRREAVIQLKNRIRRDERLYGGLFTSHLVIDEEGRPDVFCHDIDVYFPGSDKFTLWNADISTATSELWGKVRSMAFNTTWEQLTSEDMEEESRLDFIPHSRSRTGKVLTYKIATRPERRYDQFDGRTLNEQISFIEKDLLENNPPLIYEGFTMDMDYAYGIGLRMVIDEEYISVDSINRAIEKFRSLGEKDWRADDPVPSDRLPKKTEREFAKEQQAHFVLKGRPVRMDY